MSLKHLFLILLSVTYVSGSSCIFGIKDGSISGDCKVSNEVAVGIIVAVVVVVLVVILIFGWVYCWKAMNKQDGKAAQGIHLCSYNCHCCHRHVPEQTHDIFAGFPPPYEMEPAKY